ncbi:MAG: UvrD-helicase domain-containing protein [Opitutales bacterium]|jgi:ATP-dependent exoDNAse (exonuclease V) beta subunit
MNLSDQADRDRFTRETDKNFSVIAPAGVGKTTAIAGRVLQLAREDEGRRAAGLPARLPSLVVVTYTRKAADELRDRARKELVKARVRPEALSGFNRAFFGTIHSFCLELLRRFGPLAGWTGQFVVEQDDAAWWLAFQRDTPEVAAFLPEAARAAWRCYGEAEAVWVLAKTWPSGAVRPAAPGACPTPEFGALASFKAKRKHARSEENRRRVLERLRRWQKEAATGGRALGVPEIKGGGEEFGELGNAALQPLREWLAAAAAHAAAGLATEYGRFKERSGRLGYDDFVRLAGRLLRDPVLAERIRAAEFSVLLDEAQDTDPGQFAVLVGVAQPMGAPGCWTEGAGAPPAPGRFSMVGDPQQAIYTRANVGAYQELHRRLVESGAGDELTFSVTLRCDTSIVERVNAVFPKVLNGYEGQARFVPLQARPGAGVGTVWRLPVRRPESFPAKPSVAERTRAEAEALARWLATAGPAGAGAEDWSQVAVLAPRKDWLGALAVALRAAGLRAQMHTGDRAPGANPARAWLGALLAVVNDPADGFEVAGVLREIFGISDDALFHWCRANGTEPRRGPGHPLSIQQAPRAGAGGSVAEALAVLHRVQRSAAARPLRDAVALVVFEIRLRERLETLPEATAGGAALDALLNQAAQADARGETLADFAQALRRGPEETTEPAAQPGELQLLTCHKAKGLEWPVVILFGLFRKPGFPSAKYPRWLPAAKAGEAPGCLYDKGHAEAASTAGSLWKFNLEQAQRAEFERLLYVAMTRPKRTLMIVDAFALGPDEGSLADVLGLLPGGGARAWWESLPTENAATDPLEAKKVETTSTETTSGWPEPAAEISAEVYAQARARAEKFTRRVRPSTLARHGAGPKQGVERMEPDLFAPPDYPEEQPPATAMVNYGNWWHALMEATPWTQGPAAWAAHWEKSYHLAPDPERARAEGARLLASPLAVRLAAPGLEFVTELPFLWAEAGGERAFDGCVDLAAWDAAAARWLVVDWKTDRVEREAATELRARYGAQVAVYAQALGTVYGAPADAYLYSTRAGELIAV